MTLEQTFINTWRMVKEEKPRYSDSKGHGSPHLSTKHKSALWRKD